LSSAERLETDVPWPTVAPDDRLSAYLQERFLPVGCICGDPPKADSTGMDIFVDKEISYGDETARFVQKRQPKEHKTFKTDSLADSI
jgi:hypothetical protein